MKKKEQKIQKKFKHKVKISLAILLCTIICIMCYLNFVVNPVIIATSTAKVRSLSQRAVEGVVWQVLSDSALYDTLINITRNDNGDVVAVSSNSATINMLALELAEKAQDSLSQMGASGVDIPIGSFSGMPIFTGRGPCVNIKMLPIGTIYCKFFSSFSSAGINQTNHRVYLRVMSSVSVILLTGFMGSSWGILSLYFQKYNDILTDSLPKSNINCYTTVVKVCKPIRRSFCL